jgi:hypothetical protein
MVRSLFIIATMIITVSVHGQWEFAQYFDGADTSTTNSLLIQLDGDSGNVWMVGSPQKTVFNAAYTAPNAILTDTISSYPPGIASSFTVSVQPDLWGFGILAVQWMQKLDYEMGADGGMVEFSGDDGITWDNAFTSPYVYSYYGFLPENKDTLANGTTVFTGTDTTWRNVWFCMDLSWMWGMEMDTLLLRFTHIADSVESEQDGWMIDNMLAAMTIVHTINEEDQDVFMKLYPSPTSGNLRIEVHKEEGYHVIESIELIDARGRVVQSHGLSPVKFTIDISGHPDGLYQLRVRTNKGQQTLPVVLAR